MMSDIFDFGNDDFSISIWMNTTDSAVRPAPILVNFREADNDPHIELYVITENGNRLLTKSPNYFEISS